MAFDFNALRAENARLAKPAGGGNFLDNFVPMPEGEGAVTIRLLPPKGDAPLPFVATRTHKINNKNLHCPCTLVGDRWVGACPICNHYRALWKESDSASESESKALIAEAMSIKPRERYYWNAIVRSVVNKEGVVENNVGPKIFSTGVKLQKKLIRFMCGVPELEEDALGDVTDPNTGRDLKVIKTVDKQGKDSFPDYTTSKFLKESVAGTQAEVDKWINNLHDLNALRVVKSQEELAREVRIHRGLEQDTQSGNGGDFGGGADEDVPVAPKPKPAAAVSKPVAKPAAPVEDDDEPMADDDFLAKLRSM